MFTQQQLNTIDRRYFSVFNFSPFSITLKSKNTRHFWRLDYDSCKKKYTLFHSHQGDGNYHIQGHPKNLPAAIYTIKNHDSYQLKYRAPEDNDFDYIPLLPDSEYFIF